MKKELVKILTTLAAIFVCVVFIDFDIGELFDSLIKKLPSEGERVAKSNYVINTVNSDVIIVGSSRALCHYNPLLMQDRLHRKTVFNCGVDGSSFYYQVALINAIFDRYTPELIIWDLQVDELVENNVPENLSLLYPYYWKNERIRAFLNEREPELKFKIWMNAYRYNATAGRILRAVRMPESNSLGFGGHPAHDASRTIEHKILEPSKAQIDKEKVKWLDEILSRAKEQGAKVCVVVSPYYYTFSYESETISTLKEVCPKYGVQFINDSQLPKFVANAEMIYDANHLNCMGAAAFTKILIEQLLYVAD